MSQLTKSWQMSSQFPRMIKEDIGNYKFIRLVSVPGKIMEKIRGRVIEKPLKDNVSIGHWGHSFTRESPV